MTDDKFLSIKIDGLDALNKNLAAMGKKLMPYVTQGLAEAAKDIVDTEGLRQYPPETAANRPPTPYYIRGRGTQYKSHNAGNSEKYGAQYHINRTAVGARIYNRASYAPYLAGAKQSKAMAAIGWRKLEDVIKEKMGNIRAKVGEWINKAKSDAGLK